MPPLSPHPAFPVIRPAGIDGMLVSFRDRLDEPANRAALAFRGALEASGWRGIEETTASLVSVLIRFDPGGQSHADLHALLQTLLDDRDWYAADLPDGRKFWRIPAVFGTDLAPQLAEAADMAGLTPDQAITSLTQTRLRVQTIGFAPGQPYLGELPPDWNIPRQTNLTPRIPVGAIALAIRQLVMFSVASPTGWRHVGQTALRLFRPDSETPFVLRPGDEVMYRPVTRDQFETLRDAPDGGATSQAIT